MSIILKFSANESIISIAHLEREHFLIHTYETNYRNNKFWEELIAYFPLTHGPHRKRRLQKIFVAARTCLPRETNPQTLLWYDTDRMENDASNNPPVVAHVFVAAVTFLPSRCLATYTYRHKLMGGIYEVRRWDGLMCHHIHTKFHKIGSGIQKLISGGYTDIQTGRRTHKPDAV
jgi:hypothetical protein